MDDKNEKIEELNNQMNDQGQSGVNDVPDYLEEMGTDFDENAQIILPDKKHSFLKEVLQWVQAVLIATVLAYLIHGFVFERALVDGRSMMDTLQDRENLIVFKLGYFFHPPRHGDIIVFEYMEGSHNKYAPLPDPNEIDYIKRVIGLPGDTVDIRDGHVVLNGKMLDEPYAKGRTDLLGGNVSFPLKVPDGKLFVLGDNRENSSDSRRIGVIDFSRVRGKAVIRISPFEKFGSLYKNMK